jgi:Transposase Tn5 dimerisation domain
MKRIESHAVVLAIQDTTELDYSHLKQTTGLGFINQSLQQGLKVHSCLAVSAQGEPLGILHQQTWSRTQRRGQRENRRKKTTMHKESQRWLDTVDAAELGMNDAVTLVHVGDREADIFDLFIHPRRANSQLLIRVEHNRKVQHEFTYLVPTLAQAPVLGETTIEIQRNPTYPARQAQVRVRGMALTLAVPRHHKSPSQCQPVRLNVLLVEEPTPPEQGSPIHWMLVTTLPIETFEQAWQCVFWYSLRWLIERFHYTLKSGCKIEHLQLETANRLVKALATYSIVAWRLMWLTYRARLTPDEPCDAVLAPPEWRLLRRKFEPKNRSQKPPSLRQAVRWIAQLGGFLARTRDGDPGLKTLWRGLGVLHHLLEGAHLTPTT